MFIEVAEIAEENERSSTLYRETLACSLRSNLECCFSLALARFPRKQGELVIERALAENFLD